jgi:hypothetical protein
LTNFQTPNPDKPEPKIVAFFSFKNVSKKPIHRRDAEHAEEPFFPLAGGAANGKPLIATRIFSAEGSELFSKIGISRF